MADPRGILIHIGQGLSPDPAPQDAIEPVLDPFLRALDRHPEGEEDGEIALVVMEAEEGGAQATVITVVMMIGAAVEAVGEVAVADVKEACLILIFQRRSLGP